MTHVERHGESYTRLHYIWDKWMRSYKAFSDWAKASGHVNSLTLDRIENDKGYSPSNCRWVDRKT